MCSPTLAFTAISTALSLRAQQQSASAQVSSQEAAMQANIEANSEQQNLARQDEAASAEATVRSLKDAEIKSKQDKARITVAAGESGVTGNSVDSLLADANRQMFGFRETKLRETQLNAQASNSRIKTGTSNVLRTNLNVNRPITGGSGLATLASGISRGITQYNAR